MKVLIAVDGSEGSWEAVRQAGALLAGGQDEVALYYSPPEIRYPRAMAPSKDTADRSRSALAEAVFSEACKRLPNGCGDKVHRIVGTRTPRQGVVIAADEWQADLIAVGARGVGPIENLLLGSVSKAVVHEASVPVFVARPGPDGKGQSAPRALLAWEHPETSRPTFEFVNRLHWPSGSVGRLIHVIEPMFAGQLPPWLETMARDTTIEPMARAWVEEHDAEKRRAQEELAKLCHDLPPAFQSAPPIVAEGYPSEQILKAAQTEHANLIILGARRMGTLNRWLLGSTSEKVLTSAPCSVLVVREREKA